jgi:hypothetical protein
MPVNGITLVQAKTDSNNQMITISKGNRYITYIRQKKKEKFGAGKSDFI